MEVTFDGRRPSVKDDLWWKATFGGRQPLVEDDPWCKMTFCESRPLVEDNPCMLPSPLCCILFLWIPSGGRFLDEKFGSEIANFLWDNLSHCCQMSHFFKSRAILQHFSKKNLSFLRILARKVVDLCKVI